ncbi:eukaryotic aspartyl protease, partial [Oesophagostomum dentatum]
VCEIFCPNKICCNKRKTNKVNPCRGKRYFESSKSSTYFSLNKTFESKYIVYRKGAKVHGILGEDTVRLGSDASGGLSVPRTQIGQAKIIDDYFTGHRYDGIIGMAFSSLSRSGFVPPFELASSLGLVEPVFTFYMKSAGGRAEDEYGGAITYGGLDREHCSEDIFYKQLESTTYWKFKYNKEHDLYYIDCNADISAVVTIDRQKFTIEAKNLIIKLEEDVCILAIHGYSNYFASIWIFGAPFIRQYCTVYDIGNTRIGFAKSLQQ